MYTYACICHSSGMDSIFPGLALSQVFQLSCVLVENMVSLLFLMSVMFLNKCIMSHKTMYKDNFYYIVTSNELKHSFPYASNIVLNYMPIETNSVLSCVYRQVLVWDQKPISVSTWSLYTWCKFRSSCLNNTDSYHLVSIVLAPNYTSDMTRKHPSTPYVFLWSTFLYCVSSYIKYFSYINTIIC